MVYYLRVTMYLEENKELMCFCFDVGGLLRWNILSEKKLNISANVFSYSWDI